MHDKWSSDLVRALAEPFPAEAHKVMSDAPGKPIIVGIHEYKRRLNHLVGPHGWQSGVRLQAIGGKMVSIVSVSVLGVTKENVGDEVEVPELNERGNEKIIGSPATNSYSQAFKRTCSDFGLGEYLYDKERVRGIVDGPIVRGSTQSNGSSQPTGGAQPQCPVCDGPMWDNRQDKKSPNAPDFKCKKTECGKNNGVYWPGEWPPVEGGVLAEEAAEMDRVLAGAQTIVNDIKGMDAEVGDACQNLLDEHIKMEKITADQLRKLGGKFLTRLNKLKEEAMAAVGAGEDDDLPF